ncbi:MAG: hypothetical protein RLY75_790, partial [Pseudomonadota bacterium]
ERIKLGTFPQMTVEQARKQAELVNGTIADRQNPAAIRRAVKVEPIFSEVLEDFIKKKRSRSVLYRFAQVFLDNWRSK